MTNLKWLLSAGILASSLAMSSAAIAASFDCGKASRPIEKTICADPALSKADEDMAAAYRAALAVDRDTFSLRRDQREWLARLENPNDLSHDYAAFYSNRVEELNKIAAAWHDFSGTFTAEQLAKACFVTPEADHDQTCKIEETGKVAGDEKLVYQLQGFYDGTLRMNGGSVIFAPGAGGVLMPIVMGYSDTTHFSRPRIVSSPAGTFLWLPGYIEGTGNFNGEQLYLRVGATWRDVERDSWQDTLSRRLPKDLYAAKGIYPDYKKMTAVTPLWSRERDGNCCATGGRADIKLGLRGTAIVLDDVRVTRGEKAADSAEPKPVEDK
jgi:uncharacterized protein